MDTQMVLTHTGKIYFNRSLGLEFLTVGDYGKENNIKADFLGLTKKIEGVQHHDVDLMDKWVATISSQKGCPMKCTFCDVHKYGFFGNASLPDLEYQIRYIIEHEDARFTNRFNVHYARISLSSRLLRSIKPKLPWNTTTISLPATTITASTTNSSSPCLIWAGT